MRLAEPSLEMRDHVKQYFVAVVSGAAGHRSSVRAPLPAGPARPDRLGDRDQWAHGFRGGDGRSEQLRSPAMARARNSLASKPVRSRNRTARRSSVRVAAIADKAAPRVICRSGSTSLISHIPKKRVSAWPRSWLSRTCSQHQAVLRLVYCAWHDAQRSPTAAIVAGDRLDTDSPLRRGPGACHRHRARAHRDRSRRDASGHPVALARGKNWHGPYIAVGKARLSAAFRKPTGELLQQWADRPLFAQSLTASSRAGSLTPGAGVFDDHSCIGALGVGADHR